MALEDSKDPRETRSPSGGATAASRTSFITSLGVRHDKAYDYQLESGGPVVTSRYAGAALARLLFNEPRNVHAIVLVTEKSKKAYPALEADLMQVGLEVDALEMPEDMAAANGLADLVRAFATQIPSRARVVLDITHGLRHLPFTAFTLAIYLRGLREAEIDGIYYGALEVQKSPIPLLNLQAQIKALDWFAALEVARHAGDFRPLSAALSSDVADAFKSKGDAGPRDLGSLKKSLTALSFAVRSGLPLEAGLHASWLRGQCRSSADRTDELGFARLALGPVLSTLERFALCDEGCSSKEHLELSRGELERELGIIRWYAERDDQHTALGLLREWLVSWQLWAAEGAANWLKYETRALAARKLSALSARSRDKLLEDKTGERIAELWSGVADRRNAFAHAAMRKEEQKGNVGKLWSSIGKAAELLDTHWPSEIEGSDQLLVTPLGLAPGVLYTAVQRCGPDSIWVITSALAAQKIDEALERASFSGEREIVEIEDPHGFDSPPWEKDSALGQRLDRALTRAARITINITGGTTALQYLCGRIARRARELGRPVCEGALIDRRPYDEQRRDPWVAGEWTILEEAR